MAEALWTAHEIAEAVGGRRYGADFAATGVSIDTRTLQTGDLFVALAGARDGEDFIPAAFAQGAAGALSRAPHATPGVEVKDALQALTALGAAARRRAPGVKACAVTGSVGKTSVTQALAAALSATGETHASVKSFNNHIGVPLTLARMPKSVRFGVFEIGMNHAEEIRPLTKLVAPCVAVVTTVGGAHTENFADGEAGVARAKAEIFDGLGGGGVAILNLDNPWFEVLRAAALARGAEIWTFGADARARARLLDAQAAPGGLSAQAVLDGARLDLRLGAPGRHTAMNALAVLLAVKALGADVEAAVARLSQLDALPGRGRRVRLGLPSGEAMLIDESYNANPLSMAAALSVLGETPVQGRRVAALTDMLELGELEAAAHLGLLAPLQAARVDLVYAAGERMKPLFDQLPAQMKGAWRETAGDLEPLLVEAVRPGDVVMVKGSNGSHAGRLAAALVTAFGGGV